ncbi:MAG: transaldolase [Acidiferrobacteraceae bacterium]
MKATQAAAALGQSLWLDNITRDLVQSGTLRRYIDELSVTGLTSNPSIFDHAIGNSGAYDASLHRMGQPGRSDEDVFFDVASEDIIAAADLFSGVHERTEGVDGWVSLEVSPVLAYDTARTVAQAERLWQKLARPNLFIKIPGTPEGDAAIEQAIFAGVPINVTLLFSEAHYRKAADAYMRGLERRRAAGLDLNVASVASLFVSRWDAATSTLPADVRNRLGIAVAREAYRAYREVLDSERWRTLVRAGARAQRLLWASTSTKDPSVSDVLYVEALVAPDTINTLPERTLLAFADHGRVTGALDASGDADGVMGAIKALGVDLDALAGRLQREGAHAFEESWKHLMSTIHERKHAVQTGHAH